MKKILLSICLSCLTSLSVYASGPLGGYDAGALNREYVKEMRMHEVISGARQKNSAIVSPRPDAKLPKEVVSAELKNVVFINNDSFSSSELKSLVQDKIGQPMSPENIAAVRKSLMKFYQDNGYFSAVALVKSEDAQTGELVIELKEGGKNSIQIQE